jgi:hypothetical protein
VRLPGAYVSGGTNYEKGINGIMVDVANLPADRTLTADDFEFLTGTSANVREWQAAPRPTSVTVRRGAGQAGSDRVTLVWPDGSIVNRWLRVKTNLPFAPEAYRSDVFYLGNLVGDTVPPQWGFGDAVVEDADVERAAAYVGRTGIPASRVTMWDYSDVNADSIVDQRDVEIVRSNLGARLPAFWAPQPNRAEQVPPARRSPYGPARAAPVTALVRAPQRDQVGGARAVTGAAPSVSRPARGALYPDRRSAPVVSHALVDRLRDRRLHRAAPQQVQPPVLVLP